MKKIKDITADDVIYGQNKIAGADFSNITDPEHKKGDNDCLCSGCIKILDRLAKEMAERFKNE